MSKSVSKHYFGWFALASQTKRESHEWDGFCRRSETSQQKLARGLI
nr:MAG TPA: hypothetical protein [Caudoviricetes sp.]